ncbi:MAG: Gfo/Idh/MocA family protein [Pontibacterium sp.]
MLNLIVAGAGLIGKTHVALINQSDRCQLVAIVDPMPAGKAFADEQGVPCYGDLSEALARESVDGVILATPNQLHVSQARECIEANVAVLIEKPVADNLAEGKRLVEAVEAKGAKVLVGHHRAHSPLLARAKALIDTGEIGTPVAVMGSALFYKPDDYFEQALWRTQKGGGPILINLIHEIGNLRYLCGEITHVQAISSNAQRQFEVEDTAVMSFRFAEGALGSFALSDSAACARSWEQTSQENPSYASYDDEDCYVIAGTRGSLSIPTMRIKRYGNDTVPSWWSEFDCKTAEVERQDPLACQLVHFCDVIKGEAKPKVSARDGLKNLAVIDAIGKALESGQIEAIDP